MKGKKTILMEKKHPELLVAPHVVDRLFHLLAGEWQPDASLEKQLMAHFIECSFCRTASIGLLLAEQELEGLSTDPENPFRHFIERLVTILYEIEAVEHEDMGAYAEAIITVGKTEADKRFSQFAEHISRCPKCQSALEETLAFLNESEGSG